MRNTYSMAVVAKCPKGGRDEYLLVVVADEIIEVEKLIDIAVEATAEPIFQEDLTEAIAKELERVCRDNTMPPVGQVRLTGYHSGVKCESVAEFGIS